MPRALKYILYAGVFIVTYALFTYWMLPTETLKAKVIALLEKELGPGYQVQIDAMDTFRLTGAQLENVVIKQLALEKSQTVFHSDRIRARVGLFSLLFGRPKIAFDAKVEKARVQGWLKRLEEGFQMALTFRDVDVKDIPLVSLNTGLDLQSTIDGEASLSYNAREPLRTEGTIEISFKKLFLKKSTIPLGEMGSFPLPDLNLAASDSTIKASIGKGSMHIDALKLKADDFDLDLKGRVFLAPQILHYRINLQGTFQFSPKVWGVFDPLLPESFLGELKKQKGKEDHYPLTISGQLDSPQVYAGTLRVFPFKPF